MLVTSAVEVAFHHQRRRAHARQTPCHVELYRTVLDRAVLQGSHKPACSHTHFPLSFFFVSSTVACTRELASLSTLQDIHIHKGPHRPPFRGFTHPGQHWLDPPGSSPRAERAQEQGNNGKQTTVRKGHVQITRSDRKVARASQP